MRICLLALLLLLLLPACAPNAPAVESAPPPAASPAVAFETILPPDAIPALDHPKTVSAAEADAFVGPLEPVMGLEVGGEARAYPIGLMSRYEIANDTLGGEPVAVTFCPLCNSGVAFSRTVTGTDGSPLELTFGLSGKLLDGALVMHDRQTGTLWAQSRLQAMEGALAGARLELIVANQLPWQEWVAQHPATTLVVDERAAQAAPAFDLPALPSAGAATSGATPTSVTGYVVGVASGTASRAYPLDAIQAARVVNDEAPGVPPFVLVALDEPGAVAAWQRTHEGQPLTFAWKEGTLVDQETGSHWNPRTGQAESGSLAGVQLPPAEALLTHWLGWYDLYPGTEVWQG